MGNLTENGFIIYPIGSFYGLQKVKTTKNSEVLNEKIFEKYEDAEIFAENFLKNTIKYYVGIVRYNRNLGPEYKNLGLIEATNLEDAEKIAYQKSKLVIDDQYIKEIKVRPKKQ